MAHQLSVTVDLPDLEAAIKAMNVKDAAQLRCETCLIAQALTRTTGRPASVGIFWAHVSGERAMPMPKAAGPLMDLFDNEAYDDLRAQLPQTIVFEVRP